MLYSSLAHVMLLGETEKETDRDGERERETESHIAGDRDRRTA